MKDPVKQLSGMLIVIICLLVVSSNVQAGQEGTKLSGPGQEHRLETMTVTAQKTEENVQTVPVPVTTFDEIAIEDAGIEDVDDVIEFVPNMVFNDSYMKGYHEINFRGISLSQFTGKNPVVIFIDGIAQDNHANYGADILDIARI